MGFIKEVVMVKKFLACYKCGEKRKCKDCTVPNETEKIIEKMIEAELGEYATILMNLFSNSCEFYFTNDGCTIEAMEKAYIDDVILKCLEKVKEQKE